MQLERLTLTNVRTFRNLDVSLERGLHVVTGPNGCGKTNLLESIALLATTRSSRAGADVEIISQEALYEEPLPVARLYAEVVTNSEPVSVEVAITCRGSGIKGKQPPTAGRRFRVNGIARRASDLIGQLRVVHFSADDIQIIAGSPGQRRRYLDITISQLDSIYVRALQRYQRVLQQRNGLLRRLQERHGRSAEELDFWDGELAAAGGIVLVGRALALDALSRRAAEHHSQLAPESGSLEVCYQPRLPAAQIEIILGGATPEEAAVVFQETLLSRRADDIAAGVTRSGPHRDDVSFKIGDQEAGIYASRGEQRTVALALRLAEVAFSHERTGDPPLLLLDDILSELDVVRRERVLVAAYGVDQVILTTPDLDRPSKNELPGARRYSIERGKLLTSSA